MTDPEEMKLEIARCYKSPSYFITNYCMIYDSVTLEWIPFKLWTGQKETLAEIHNHQLVVILKARQLGISWLALAYALWSMLFRPIARVSIFSRREEESSYLMGKERLRGIFENLPAWLRSGYVSTTDRTLHWVLNGGSSVRAFSTSSGDGYVSTLAIVDEADLSPDLNTLMRSVKPTIDNGGKMIMLSRSNKEQPDSEFKRTYAGAKEGSNPWHPVFLPWYAHPARSLLWYEAQKQDIQSRTGGLDDLHEQYPETDDQALASKQLSKRIPSFWLEAVYERKAPIVSGRVPSIPGLTVYALPTNSGRYVLGADPAEGNPNSDDSACTVVEIQTGEEVACLVGKIEPAVFANYVSQVSAFYNYCPAMVERNNHGHSVIQWMEEHSRRTRLLLGHDADSHKKDKKSRTKRKGLKFGWLSSTLGKTILYTTCANYIRDCAGVEDSTMPKRYLIHSELTKSQLVSIESSSLSAPNGFHDDRADSFALAICGRKQVRDAGEASVMVAGSMQGWGQ